MELPEPRLTISFRGCPASKVKSVGSNKMLTEGRECRDVVTQISAARKALDQTGFKLVASGLTYCLSHPEAAAGEGYASATGLTLVRGAPAHCGGERYSFTVISPASRRSSSRRSSSWPIGDRDCPRLDRTQGRTSNAIAAHITSIIGIISHIHPQPPFQSIIISLQLEYVHVI